MAGAWASLEELFERKYIRTKIFPHGATLVAMTDRGVQYSRVFGEDKEDSIYVW